MNDVFRQEFTALTEEQSKAVLSVKQKAQELWNLIDAFEMKPSTAVKSKVLNPFGESIRLSKVAKTNLEIAVMCAIKSITTNHT